MKIPQFVTTTLQYTLWELLTTVATFLVVAMVVLAVVAVVVPAAATVWALAQTRVGTALLVLAGYRMYRSFYDTFVKIK